MLNCGKLSVCCFVICFGASVAHKHDIGKHAVFSIGKKQSFVDIMYSILTEDQLSLCEEPLSEHDKLSVCIILYKFSSLLYKINVALVSTSTNMETGGEEGFYLFIWDNVIKLLGANGESTKLDVWRQLIREVQNISSLYYGLKVTDLNNNQRRGINLLLSSLSNIDNVAMIMIGIHSIMSTLEHNFREMSINQLISNSLNVCEDTFTFLCVRMAIEWLIKNESFELENFNFDGKLSVQECLEKFVDEYTETDCDYNKWKYEVVMKMLSLGVAVDHTTLAKNIENKKEHLRVRIEEIGKSTEEKKTLIQTKQTLMFNLKDKITVLSDAKTKILNEKNNVKTLGCSSLHKDYDKIDLDLSNEITATKEIVEILKLEISELSEEFETLKNELMEKMCQLEILETVSIVQEESTK